MLGTNILILTPIWMLYGAWGLSYTLGILSLGPTKSSNTKVEEEHFLALTNREVWQRLQTGPLWGLKCSCGLGLVLLFRWLTANTIQGFQIIQNHSTQMFPNYENLKRLIKSPTRNNQSHVQHKIRAQSLDYSQAGESLHGVQKIIQMPSTIRNYESKSSSAPWTTLFEWACTQ